MVDRRIKRGAGRHLFGTDSTAYHKGRPDYPLRVYDVLTQSCGLQPGTRLLEVGAGTGLATRRLAALGAGPIVAIEPDPRLAAHLEGIAGADGSAVEILLQPFEDVRLETASFDLAAAATAFHWIEQARGLAKVADLLRPGGAWAMWWTVFGDPSEPDPFQLATAPLFEGLPLGPSHTGAADRSFALDIDARLGDLRAVGSFTRIESETVRWSIQLDPAQMRALYATFSTVTALKQTEQQRILDAIEALAGDEPSGRIERRFVTAIYTAQRRS